MSGPTRLPRSAGSQIAKVAGGSLGAAYTLNLALTTADIVVVEGTLTANNVFTLSNRRKCIVILLVTQDATGGRTLTISDGAASQPVLIPDGASESGAVQCTLPDATNVYVDVAGGEAPADASVTVKGLSKLSVAPASATDPIAVGSNDPKVTADQAAGTASIRTLGTGAIQAAAGNHTHADAAAAVKGLTKLSKAPVSATDPIALGSNERGAASGVASLDGSTKVPVAEIPTVTAAMVAADVATQAELDAHTGANLEGAHGIPAVAALQSIRRNAGDTAWEAYTPAGGESLEGIWVPSQQGLKAAVFDPVIASASTAPGGGLMQLVKLYVPTSQTIANLCLYVATAGATLTAGQNFGALYSSAGVLIAKTADQTTPWQTSGFYAMALTVESGQSLTLGGTGVWVYAAFYSNGTTRPAFARAGANINHVNAGLSATTYRHAATSATYTTDPPATLPALTLSNALLYWAGLS